MGVTLAHRGTVQVSMNLTDFTRTSIARAFDRVREEADRHSVAIARSELIGLAPRAALTAGIAAHVRLDDYDDDRMILERRLEAAGLG
jgi:glutamate formiminotransferase